jgi:hypothetical protein
MPSNPTTEGIPDQRKKGAKIPHLGEDLLGQMFKGIQLQGRGAAMGGEIHKNTPEIPS